MDIEEELAELKAELKRTNEKSKVIRYAKSDEYRYLLNKASPKICDICGKEYKITHLCETEWKFVWNDFWERYAAEGTYFTNSSVTTRQTSSTSKAPIIESEKTSSKPSVPPYPSPSDSGDRPIGAIIGICCCFLVLIIGFAILLA